MKWIVIIIVVVALAVGCMRTGLPGDCIGIAGFAWYALIPFLDKRRVRARWATLTILFNGLLGVVYSSAYLMLHSGWLVVGSHANHAIRTWLLVVGGIFLGVTFTLMIAGQLPGAKRSDQEVRHDPAA